MIHECEETPKDYEIQKGITWEVVSSIYIDIYVDNILFCPFCGEKLE